MIKTSWINLFNLSSFFILTCDAPDFWQLRLQNPASSIMKGILLLNKHLLFIIIMIVILVGWLLFNTIYSYDEFNNSQPANFFHSNELEIRFGLMKFQTSDHVLKNTIFK